MDNTSFQAESSDVFLFTWLQRGTPELQYIVRIEFKAAT